MELNAPSSLTTSQVQSFQATIAGSRLDHNDSIIQNKLAQVGKSIIE